MLIGQCGVLSSQKQTVTVSQQRTEKNRGAETPREKNLSQLAVIFYVVFGMEKSGNHLERQLLLSSARNEPK
jgi:hypothetical protein